MVKLTWRHWGERPHQLLIDKAQSPCGMPWLIQFERGERRKIFKNILFQLSSFSGGSLRSKIDYDYTNLFIHLSCVVFFLYESHARCWRWCVDHDTMLMDFLTFLPPLGRQTDMPHETLTYFFLTKPFFFSDGFWECWEFLRNWNIRRIQEVGTSSCIKIVMRERIDSMEWEYRIEKRRSLNINHNKEF